MSSEIAQLDFSSVPLFPLPGVVLLPRAVMPLHIFEDRYRDMTADALEGDGLIAMALLKPGWEKNYYGRAEIHPVVCIGQILSSERLADGKYNFLLQGVQAAMVEEEFKDKPYRRARLKPLEITQPMEIDLERQRRRLVDLFFSTPLGAMAGGLSFQQLVKSPIATVDVVNVLAFTLLEDVGLKQSLLEETDSIRRVDRAIEAFSKLAASLPSSPGSYQSGRGDPRMN